MKRIILIANLLCLGLYAQDTTFDPEKSQGELYEYAEFTSVGLLNLDILEVVNNDYLDYTKLESDNHSVGFTSDNYWVRFEIKNSTPKEQTYYLETARPITDVANLYQITGFKIETFKSGDQLAFNEKQVQHRSTVFKILLPPQQTQQFYLHLKSDGETINIPLNLYSESSFWMVNYSQQLFLGLFYGLLFLAAIIYLFFYSSLKKKAFLYYGVYVFSIAFMQLTLDGIMHQYIFPGGGYINSRLVLITALFSNWFLLKYCESFLKIEERSRILKKGYNFAYAIIAILFVMPFISLKTLEITYPISNVNGLFSLLLILASTVTLKAKRVKIDSYFSLGIFFLVIGLLGFVMNNLSLLPNNFYTLNSAKFGSGLEVIFLSLSMTNLIRKLRIEKEHSQLEALKKSEEISQLKTYFMSNMSHELRTPINAIMGVAEDELDKVETTETKEAFELIKNASLSLLSNVNDIIDFEKIENNQLTLNNERFNPIEKLTQISDNWKTEAHRKGLSYQLKVDKNMPNLILADPKRLVQILNNVLANAVKFTNTGGIFCDLSCTKDSNGLCKLMLQISDTGVGFDQNSNADVFESFNQMRLDHKREFGGIGLGLTIVNHIIKLFNGSIHIESEINKGTTVSIELIVRDVSSQKGLVQKPVSIDSKPLHVLVVEDNKMNQMVLCKILKTRENITFSIANNGQEALDALQKERYHIILMDLQMPVMDGYEAAEIIKSGNLGKTIEAIPIIAVTADAMEETKQRVLNLGMNDYMTKPVDKSALLEKIYEHSRDAVLKIA